MAAPFVWDDVKLFLSAARSGGFGAAARELGTMQSTVSRRVAALEAALGVRLFDRAPTGIELTAAGRRVVMGAQPAEAALLALSDVAAVTTPRVSGVVRLALSETLASLFVIPRVLPALLETYPELVVDLVVSDAPTDLARRDADLALRFFLPPKGDFVTRRVARLDTAPLVHRRLAKTLAKQRPSTWPWVTVGRPSLEEAWLAPLQAKPRLTTSSFHTQFEAVSHGLGVAVLPRLITQLRSELVEVPLVLETAAPALDLFLVTPRGLRRAARVAAVFDALTVAFDDVGGAAREQR
ncbi:MAG: LysR family transcriptional regulator [Myxococcales bacterium]|nr:LysR family transcriptional regulator [Myxococcales bacterium]